MEESPEQKRCDAPQECDVINNEQEEWRNIPGHDKYQVSNEGRVRSLKTNRILSSCSCNGYRQVGLYSDGKQKTITIHRLVALAFLGDRPMGIDGRRNEVNHKDGDRANNRLSNLEYVTRAENVIHSYAMNPYWERNLSINMRPEVRQWHIDYDRKRKEELKNAEQHQRS